MNLLTPEELAAIRERAGQLELPVFVSVDMAVSLATTLRSVQADRLALLAHIEALTDIAGTVPESDWTPGHGRAGAVPQAKG